MSVQTMADTSMKEVPVGSQCEECFEISRAFPLMSFDQLCSKYRTDAKTREGVDMSRKVLRKDCVPNDFDQETVEVEEGTELIVQRSLILLNERELKHALGVVRLSKAHVAGLPVLQTESEESPGTRESVYAFHDPANPFRRSVLQWKTGVVQKAPKLGPQMQLHADQANWVREHNMHALSADHGQGELLAKIKGHYTRSLKEHVDKFGVVGDEEEEDDDNDDGAGDDDGDQGDADGDEAKPTLVGAASSVALQGSTESPSLVG